jgi:hypothetical protein
MKSINVKIGKQLSPVMYVSCTITLKKIIRVEDRHLSDDDGDIIGGALITYLFLRIIILIEHCLERRSKATE